MKLFFLSLFGILLTACASNTVEVPPLESEEGWELVEFEPLELKSEAGTVVVLDDFVERIVITSPLSLSGTVRRDWMFEGSFPITLMTLEDEIIKEWYGSGAWLEPIDGRELDDLDGDDMIEFASDIEFEAPLEGDGLGKIRFGKSLVADEDVADYVEVMILWP